MTEQEVFNLYRKLNLKHNDICVSCIAGCANNGIRLSNPASIWQVGTNYHKAKIRLLFVGKIARRGNNLGKLVSNNFNEPSKEQSESSKSSKIQMKILGIGLFIGGLFYAF